MRRSEMACKFESCTWRYYEGEFKMQNVLEKHKDILFKLKSKRIFALEVCEVLYITEMCDEWFDMELTKDDCLSLSELFKDLGEVL